MSSSSLLPPPPSLDRSRDAAGWKPVDNDDDDDRRRDDDFCCMLQDCAYTGDWDRLRSYLDTLLLQQQHSLLAVKNPAHLVTAIQDVLFVQEQQQQQQQHDASDRYDCDELLSQPPPVDIIQRLYYIAGGNKDILMMRHVVTGECLLSYWIQRGFVVSRPLLQFLLSVAPELALQTHRYDDDNLTVIQVLTRQYGAVLQEQYDYHRTAGKRHGEYEHPFWNMAYHIVHMMIQATTTTTTRTDSTSFPPSSRSSASSGTTFHSSSTISTSRQPNEVVVIKTPQQDMLRTCLRIYQQLPKPFLQLVLQHYWEQLSEPDEAGRYPLHILCANAAAAFSSKSLPYNSNNNNKDSWLLQQLVQGYPHAARIAAAGVVGNAPQQEPQFPLQLALASGRRLNECAGMQALVSYYPEALFLRSSGGSYHFNNNSLQKQQQQQQQEQLGRHRSNASDSWMVTQLASQQRAPTAVFEILRSNPDLIQREE